jgi:hypothetical protein
VAREGAHHLTQRGLTAFQRPVQLQELGLSGRQLLLELLAIGDVPTRRQEEPATLQLDAAGVDLHLDDAAIPAAMPALEQPGSVDERAHHGCDLPGGEALSMRSCSPEWHTGAVVLIGISSISF